LTCTTKGRLSFTTSSSQTHHTLPHSMLYTMHVHNKQFTTAGFENDLATYGFENPTTPIWQAKNVRNDSLGLRVPVWVTDVKTLPDGRLLSGTAAGRVRVYDARAARRPIM